ncbi:MAG: threonine--tRNA ligase [Pseudomonadota bacterium]
MFNVKLPDGKILNFEAPLSVYEIAKTISPRLAEATLAADVNGTIVDRSTLINTDAQLTLITDKNSHALEIIRHSTAHLLAHAVKHLFPTAQVTIGPVIEDGFYYDFALERSFTPEDLVAIEAKMHELANANMNVSHRVVSRAEAIDYFKSIGEHYKTELISSIPENEPIKLYTEGEGTSSFTDLCRGPHVPSTQYLKAFKLLKVAGAYWRGKSENEMLQRIYGTAWHSQKELDAYLTRLEEAGKRDHRKLGAALDLFHFEEFAPGAVFWHPKGWTLFQTLLGYMRTKQTEGGYTEVNTPDVMDRSLWEISGHWQNYRQNMFTTQTEDDRVFALKPMNCPGSVSLFNHGLKSYRDLPIRMAEFGKVHRYEPSGALHGLMRVRHFTQDDAHIYCTEEQMEDECRTVVALVLEIYKDFGFEDIRIKLSTRPDNRIGTDETWDILEDALKNALNSMSLDYSLNPGEGAFYGPKLEFVLRDAIGRDWQCGTLQVDLNLPERFNAHYVAEDNTRKRPVMLHRALFGSLERFIGILIEHHAGALPVWLAPIQATVLNISDAHIDYAKSIVKELQSKGLRIDADLRNEKINYKIREHSLQKTPYLLIVGDQERDNNTVAVRARGNQNLGALSLAAITSLLEISPKSPVA